jgi:predicted GIY-YIG superfamily endonuclease
MHYVYVLINLDNDRPYIGQTKDLRRRFSDHQQRGRFKLVYYEAYSDSSAAHQRERVLKHHGTTWTRLKQRLDSSFKLAG